VYGGTWRMLKLSWNGDWRQAQCECSLGAARQLEGGAQRAVLGGEGLGVASQVEFETNV